METVTSNNHFVPRFYLKAWAADRTHVQEYSTLVSHPTVREWNPVATKGTGKRQHLYPVEYETWSKTVIEDPVAPVIARLVDGEPLSGEDWEALVLFLAAQDLRTPAAYVEHTQRWKRDMPAFLESMLRTAEAEFREFSSHDNPLDMGFVNTAAEQQSPFTVRLASDENGRPYLESFVDINRQFWLMNVRRTVSGSAGVLLNHHWSILRPCPGETWWTSDHPVIKLNFYGDSTYDFRGGWGSDKSEIFLPLTPWHLMYTQISRNYATEIECTRKQTFDVHRLIAQRAFRSIYSVFPRRRVAWFRPRRVDPVAFRSEQEAWARWDAEQSASEQGL